MKIVYAFITAILLLAAGITLFDANEYGHTGWQIITHQGPTYIIWGVAMLAFSALFAVIAVKRYQATQRVGSMVWWALLALVFLAVVFGKGCTDVANDGVTGPKGIPTTKANPPPQRETIRITMEAHQVAKVYQALRSQPENVFE